MSLLLLNRLSGVFTSGPSLLVNVGTLNAVLSVYRGTLIQRISIVSALLALTVDGLTVYALSRWIVDPSWPTLTEHVVVLSALKRLYSIFVVYITFLRFKAVAGNQLCAASHSYAYAGIYAVLSVTTALLHGCSYMSVGWDSNAARDSGLFRAYRFTNLVCTSYFVLFGIFVDVRFLRLARDNPLFQQSFRDFRPYYNVWINIAYEVLLYVAFATTLAWSFFNADVTSSIYIEQILLSFMMSNGTYLVQVLGSRSNSGSKSTDPDNSIFAPQIQQQHQKSKDQSTVTLSFWNID